MRLTLLALSCLGASLGGCTHDFGRYRYESRDASLAGAGQGGTGVEEDADVGEGGASGGNAANGGGDSLPALDGGR